MIRTEGALFGLLSTSQDTPVDVAALVAEHTHTLFRVAYSVLRSHAEAEDAVQDTLLRVLTHRHELPQVRDMRPWLIRICWNLALDNRRKRRPEQLDQQFAEALATREADASQQYASTQHLQQVLAVIDRLPQAEKQALLLSANEELSITEIGAVMNKSESAIRALIFRARQRVRERTEGGRK